VRVGGVGRAIAGLACAVLLLGTACSSSSSGRVALDGSPRFPDREGVVTEVSLSGLTLNGHDRFTVDRRLQCFSTYTLESVPLLGRKNQYVQVGIKGHRVVWMASFAAVIRLPGQRPVVYYTGHLVKVDVQHRAIFRDGTVLRLGSNVSAPPGTAVLRAEIDTSTQRVVNLVAP
jgi:hypothetical protein